MSDWISVEKRLPEEDDAVLVCMPSADPKSPLIMVTWFTPNFGWSHKPNGWKVSHWMPLPEPPYERD